MNFRQQTLADIVRQDYRYAAVLEHLGLDFCCQGKRSLENACMAKKLDPGEVEQSLQQACLEPGTETDYASLSLTELADHIECTHHVYVREVAAQIETWLGKVAARHGMHHPEMISTSKMFTTLRNDLLAHQLKEEQVLFPLIRQLENCATGTGSGQPEQLRELLGGPVAAMEADHDNAGELMDIIHRLTSGYAIPEDACNTYRLALSALQDFEKNLHLHVHLENNLLFPRALAFVRHASLPA